jgi:putative membrane protein
VRFVRLVASFAADLTGVHDMTAFFRSICLAALLCAGTAWAQSDNQDNPHSTTAKDKQGTSTPNSATNQQTQSAESANPHSINNRDDASKPQVGDADHRIQKAESDNPDDVNYKNRQQNQGKAEMDHHGHMSDADHDMTMKNASPQMMLQALHMANLEEIKMGKLAVDKGTDRVKSYAKTLQDDHSAADQQVKDLAQKKGWTLSDTPKNEKMQQHQQAMMDRFDKLQGAQFDRAFANAMANGHQRLIRMAQGWSQNVKDQDVKSLLDQMMPKLQQHEQLAEQLKAPAAQGRAPDVR